MFTLQVLSFLFMKHVCIYNAFTCILALRNLYFLQKTHRTIHSSTGWRTMSKQTNRLAAAERGRRVRYENIYSD